MIVTNADGTQEVQQRSIEDILSGAADDVLEGPPSSTVPRSNSGPAQDHRSRHDRRPGSRGVLDRCARPGEAVYGFDVGQYRGGGPRRGPVRAGGTMSAIDALDFLRTLDERGSPRCRTSWPAPATSERLGARPERGYQDDEATRARGVSPCRTRCSAASRSRDGRPDGQRTGDPPQQRMQQFSIKDTRFAANQMAMEVRAATSPATSTTRSAVSCRASSATGATTCSASTR